MPRSLYEKCQTDIPEEQFNLFLNKFIHRAIETHPVEDKGKGIVRVMDMLEFSVSENKMLTVNSVDNKTKNITMNFHIDGSLMGCFVPLYFQHKSWNKILTTIISWAQSNVKDAAAMDVFGKVFSEVPFYEKPLAGSLSPWKKTNLSLFATLNGIFKNYALYKTKGIPHFASILGKKIWSLLDQECLDVIKKTHGFGCTVFDYNMMVLNKEEVLRTYKTNPSIVLLGMEGFKDSLRVHSPQSSAHRSTNTNKQYRLPKDIESFRVPDLVHEAKNLVARQNLIGKKYWKYLVKLPPNWLRLITKPLAEMERFTRYDMAVQMGGQDQLPDWLQHDEDVVTAKNSTFHVIVKMLVDIGEIPKYTMLKEYIRFIKGRMIASPIYKDTDLICVSRVAFKESHRKNSKFFFDEASLTFDWLLRFTVVNGELISFLDKNQKKASWSWFMRKQEEWHEDRHRLSHPDLEKIKALEWDVAFDELTINKYKIVALTNGSDLIAEGKAMHNCVSSYAKACKDGMARIFSVRLKKNDEHIATVELRWADLVGHDYWELSQHRGKHNASSPKNIKFLADRIAKEYSEKYNEDEKKKMLIDSMTEKSGEEVEHLTPQELIAARQFVQA